MDELLSVVVPVYNEEDNLGPFIDELTSVLVSIAKNYEIIFVDDGSSDKSQQIINNYRKDNSRIKVVQFTRNFGQHAAMMAGFSFATGDIVITLDADLENDPGDIPLLLKKLDEGYDVAGGWRKHRKGPLFRRVSSALVNRLLSRLTGVKLKDHGCMLRAYKRHVLESLKGLKEIPLYPIALISWLGVSVVEVPVNHRPRHSGRSRYNIFSLIKTVYMLVIAFSSFPGLSIVSLGVILISASLAVAGYLGVRLIAFSEGPSLVEIALCLLSLGQGIFLTALGYLGDFTGRIYAETLGRPHYVIRDKRGF